MKTTIRQILIVTTIVSIPIAICTKLEYDRIRTEQLRSFLQLELQATKDKLKLGRISENQLVIDYLAMADPCESQHYGRYSEFQHGFPGGLGHGITIVSKDGRLKRAYSWSCLGGEEYFNGMMDAENTEFDKLWSWAHPPEKYLHGKAGRRN